MRHPAHSLFACSMLIDIYTDICICSAHVYMALCVYIFIYEHVAVSGMSKNIIGTPVLFLLIDASFFIGCFIDNMQLPFSNYLKTNQNGGPSSGTSV